MKDNVRVIDSLNNIYLMCHDSATFKKQLIKDPVKTLKTLDENFQIDSNKNLIVEDQTNQSVLYLNIPKMPNLDDVSLTDKEMELVSGGVAAGSWDLNCLANVIDALTPDININVQFGDGNSNHQCSGHQ